ncbi:hypothetical protein CPC08DRAFT_591780, partial [Agrocybe pediades]
PEKVYGKTHKNAVVAAALAQLHIINKFIKNSAIEAANLAKDMLRFEHKADPVAFPDLPSENASVVTIEDDELMQFVNTSIPTATLDKMPDYICQRIARLNEEAKGAKRSAVEVTDDSRTKRRRATGPDLIIPNALTRAPLVFDGDWFTTEDICHLPLPFFEHRVLDQIMTQAHRIPTKKHTKAGDKSSVYIWDIEAMRT